MDKIVIQLFADILYTKGILCFEEIDALLEMRTPEDAEVFTEKLLRGGYNVYKRGEVYTDSIANN